jgi:hypothetical protein
MRQRFTGGWRPGSIAMEEVPNQSHDDSEHRNQKPIIVCGPGSPGDLVRYKEKQSWEQN